MHNSCHGASPTILLRNKTNLKENNFNFGTIIYFESLAEPQAQNR